MKQANMKMTVWSTYVSTQEESNLCAVTDLATETLVAL